MKNILIMDKHRILNGRKVDKSIQLENIEMEHLDVGFNVISRLDVLVIIDEDCDSYRMFKSRSPVGDHGKVFQYISTLNGRLKRYTKWMKLMDEMMKKDTI